MWAISDFVPRAEKGVHRDDRGKVPGLPTCGPFLILSPRAEKGVHRDGKGYVAVVPTCGPFLILSPVESIGEPGDVRGR